LHPGTFPAGTGRIGVSVKQVFQSLEDGTTSVVEVPAPQARPGHVLIRTQASVVSAGTERMLVDFGRANLFNKARQQPDRVKDVVDKVRTDGLAPTMQAVRSKLSRPITLGYANAGVVLDVGPGVTDLEPGDVVASNGPHAEVVSVARNLVVKVPDRDGEPLPAEEAAFASIGAIALQGVRLAAPSIGERFVVTGLGLIGLLTVQILRAHGCQVLGTDFDRSRLDLARSFGAQTFDLSSDADPLTAADVFSGGRGVDGVIVTASTRSSEPVHQAAQMCRKRGRIIMVGVTGLELQRNDFYDKELQFQVSCSYGPGRYDPAYEEMGQDYPLGFVRWTAARNFEAFLELVAEERITTAPLLTHRYAEVDAGAAYRALSEDPTVLAIALTYPGGEELPDRQLLERSVHVAPATPRGGRGRVAVIGAGNYTQQVLLPALTATPAVLDTIVSRGGATAASAAEQFGFERAATDVEQVFADDRIDTLFVTTRHDTHADLVLRALRAGKNVYVEKPLALQDRELTDIEQLYSELQNDGPPPVLMVGFNRRFAPLTVRMKQLLDAIQRPKSLVVTVNAGALPASHWTQDPAVGGGRIIGEGCHFIDLLRHLVGAPITHVRSTYLAAMPPDTAAIQLSFEDGSIGTVHYIATGHKGFPKERVEAFAAGRTLALDNFRSLTGFGWPGLRRERLRRQDKGHAAAVEAFIASTLGRSAAPVPVSELIETSRASILAGERA
jgi:predicted dehydrogenase/threonine dehydrogenase-like Zn-dependent dehydrogenase